MIVQLLRDVVRFVRNVSSATSESETDYDGVGSYSYEWHAAEIGGGLGLLTGLALAFGPQTLSLAMVSFSGGVVLTALGHRAPAEIGIPKKYLVQIKKELHYYLVSYMALVLLFYPKIITGGLLG